MRTLVHRYLSLWSDRRARYTTLAAMLVLAYCGFVLQPMAVEFATTHASNPVEDLILSNIPVFNVAGIFVYGMFVLIAVITVQCLLHPNRIAFTLYALALFILIRSIFVSLTHLGPSLEQAVGNFSPGIDAAFFGADLFFSGHTGAPFLMALMYWHDAKLRYFFLLWSLMFGTIVLLGHFHYSIDVLAAFFITYGIYHICLAIFPRERALFLKE
jgi:hypothetical protein